MINARVYLAFLLFSSVSSWSASLLDPVFNQGPGSNAYVEQVLPLSDGKVLICGIFTTYNNESAPYIARLDEDGSLDSTFQHTVDYWVRHMAVQPDGKIVIGGAFSSVSGIPRSLIARLNSDGTLDPTFDPGLGVEQKLVEGDPHPPYVFWLALQPDGKILITGSFAKYDGQMAKGMARLNSDGSLDASFQMGGGLDSWGRSVQVLPNDKILFTGWMTSYNGFSCNRMIMVNSDGTPDSSFRPYFGDKTSIYCAALLPNGQMIASGHTKNEQGLFSRKILRLNADGTEDTSFLGRTDDRTESVVIQPNGKILVSGWFNFVDDVYRGRLARLNADGSLDPDFIAHADQFIWTIALDHKQRILVSGGFWNIDGVSRAGVARLLDPDVPIETPPFISGISINNERVELPFKTESGRKYTLEYCNSLFNLKWERGEILEGDGLPGILQEVVTTNACRFYRLRVD